METLTSLPANVWKAFLQRQDGANIFQSPELMAVYGATRHYKPFVIAIEDGGEIIALMASVVISYLGAALPVVASRELVVGGPVGRTDVFARLVAQHDELARTRSIYTEVRNLRPIADKSCFVEGGYVWEDELNYMIDLGQGEAAVLNGMTKARRKGITSAERRGVEVVSLQPNRVRVAYMILQETYRRAGLPLADQSLFESAIQRLTPKGQLLATIGSVSGIPCAVRFALRSGNTLHDWYAGSTDIGRSFHADELLAWRLMQRGIEMGCQTFDFGGAGSPSRAYGPREFKRRFGGTEVNPGRFRKIHHPVATAVAGLALKTAAAALRPGRHGRPAKEASHERTTLRVPIEDGPVL